MGAHGCLCHKDKSDQAQVCLHHGVARVPLGWSACAPHRVWQSCGASAPCMRSVDSLMQDELWMCPGGCCHALKPDFHLECRPCRCVRGSGCCVAMERFCPWSNCLGSGDLPWLGCRCRVAAAGDLPAAVLHAACGTMSEWPGRWSIRWSTAFKSYLGLPSASGFTGRVASGTCAVGSVFD